ncbi:hypothetical protein M8J77_011142 [Diaphorina citri]|nr:hypothetical protein M8J77_011142 [Diaphorina citri]
MTEIADLTTGEAFPQANFGSLVYGFLAAGGSYGFTINQAWYGAVACPTGRPGYAIPGARGSKAVFSSLALHNHYANIHKKRLSAQNRSKSECKESPPTEEPPPHPAHPSSSHTSASGGGGGGGDKTKTSKNQKGKKAQPQRQSTIPDTAFYSSNSCGVPKSPCEASHSHSSSRALAATSSSRP